MENAKILLKELKEVAKDVGVLDKSMKLRCVALDRPACSLRGGAAAPVRPAWEGCEARVARRGRLQRAMQLWARVAARVQPARVAAAPARVRGASGERRPPRSDSPRGL